MGYFPVRYDSRVVNYDRRGFIRLATGRPYGRETETKTNGIASIELKSTIKSS